jgi:CBS domain-containing protein
MEKERTASDIMEKYIVTASPETSVFDLVDLFVKNKVAAIPVVDEEEKLIGIITDGDLLYKKIKPHVPHYVNLLGASIYYNGISEYDKGFKKLLACTAKDMMTKNVIIAAPDADVEQIAGVMVAEHLKVIPIVKDKHVVGIVTRYDILDELYSEYGTGLRADDK